MSEDELVESAMPRTFVISVEARMLNKNMVPPKVVIIEAHSIKEAKHKAFRKLAQGRYKYIRFSQLNFKSVEDVSNKGEVHEPSDSQGT